MKKLITITITLLLIAINSIAQKQTQVDSLIYTYYQEGKPGIALTIIKNKKTIHTQTVGLANIESNIPISNSTSFMIASVSKQFTAYLALQLESEGKLKMNDDIREHLPEMKSLPYKITLSQLANHTHGLPNVSELINVKGFGQSDRLWHKDVVDLALNIRTFNFKPGDQYQYNNTGFVLLAEIIERVSGITFQEALKTYIFEPLQMDNSRAIPSPNMLIKNRAESYAHRNGEYQRYDSNVMTNGSSGIRTSILDMAKWATHFQSTHTNSNSPFAKMERPSSLNNGTKLPYGLGLEIKDYKGLKAVFHGGGTTGYRAYTLHIPEHDLSVIILGNTNDYWPLELAYKTVDIFLTKFQNESIKKANKGSETARLDEIAGTYSSIPGIYYKFSAANDSLYFSLVGSEGKQALEPLGNNEFVYPFYPKSKFVFSKGTMDHFIADFVYHYESATPELKSYASDELSEFIGFYHNKALNTTYEIVSDNGQLIARHPINYDIPLQGLENDSFFSLQGFFGKLDFQKAESGEVSSFKLSGQNLVGLEFVKIN